MRALVYIQTLQDEFDWLVEPFVECLDACVRNVGELAARERMHLITDNPAVAERYAGDFRFVRVVEELPRFCLLSGCVGKTLKRLGIDPSEAILAIDHHNVMLGKEDLRNMLAQYETSGRPLFTTKTMRELAHQLAQYKTITAATSIHFFDRAAQPGPHVPTRPFIFDWARYGEVSGPGLYRCAVTRDGVKFAPCAAGEEGIAYEWLTPDTARLLFPARMVADADGMSLPDREGNVAYVARLDRGVARLCFSVSPECPDQCAYEILPFGPHGALVKAYAWADHENGSRDVTFTLPEDAAGFVVTVSRPLCNGVADSSSRFEPGDAVWVMERSGHFRRKDSDAIIVGRQETLKLVEATGDAMVGTGGQLSRIEDLVETGEAQAYPLPLEHGRMHTRLDYLRFKASERARAEGRHV